MRILVTGGNGYLGTRIVKKIVNKGDTAVLLIHERYDNSIFDRLPNIEVYSTKNKDIKIALEKKIDCVLHLATLYGRNGEDSNEILDSNLLFPLTVLEGAIKNNIKYFFNMDTMIHKLINPYTISKKHFRDWGKYYRKSKKDKICKYKI